MPVSIKGTGGGSVTLTAGAAAADTTLTLPNTSGTVMLTGTTIPVAQGGTGITSTGAVGNVLFTTDGSTWSATQKIVAGTAQASTSGTSIDFTSIPSWVKRVTVMFNGVSTNGTSIPQIQLGVSGTPETSGYSAISTSVTTSNNTTRGTTATSGFIIGYSNVSTSSYYGSLVLTLLGSNIWTASGNLYNPDGPGSLEIGGAKTLAGTLNMVRLTTVNGTDTFDAGSINILYE